MKYRATVGGRVGPVVVGALAGSRAPARAAASVRTRLVITTAHRLDPAAVVARLDAEGLQIEGMRCAASRPRPETDLGVSGAGSTAPAPAAPDLRS